MWAVGNHSCWNGSREPQQRNARSARGGKACAQRATSSRGPAEPPAFETLALMTATRRRRHEADHWQRNGVGSRSIAGLLPTRGRRSVVPREYRAPLGVDTPQARIHEMVSHDIATVRFGGSEVRPHATSERSRSPQHAALLEQHNSLPSHSNRCPRRSSLEIRPPAGRSQLPKRAPMESRSTRSGSTNDHSSPLVCSWKRGPKGGLRNREDKIRSPSVIRASPRRAPPVAATARRPSFREHPLRCDRVAN